MENQETLDIVCVIEEESGFSIHDIINNRIEPWFEMYLEEINSLEQ